MEERDQNLGATEEQEQEQAIEQAADEALSEPLAEAGELEVGEASSEAASLLEELEEVKKKEAEYLDGWQRARAELANARKRFQREQEQAYLNARADVLVRILPIVDDFERAFSTVPEALGEEAWLDGIHLILHKLQAFLKQEGVSPIEAVGQAFDPYQHQAVTHEPSETVPEGHVIDEMQKGYQMDGRVLRPSIVRVSSGPPVPAEAEAKEEAGVEDIAEEEISGAEADDKAGADE